VDRSLYKHRDAKYPGNILALIPDILSEDFLGFPQFFEGNARLVASIGPSPSLSRALLDW
jgi:hypothetical protein